MKVFLVVATIAGLMVAAAGYLLIASVPDYSEDFTVTGTSATVEILRDASGVPHVSGTSREDIFFALGFVHAQDRLGQLLRMRRAAGARGTQTTQAVLPREVETALSAYSGGINAWISVIAEGGRGRGTPELLFLRSSIAPWTPSDSLAIAEAFLASLRENPSASLSREEVKSQIPTDRPDTPELYGAATETFLRAWGLPAERTASSQPIVLAEIAGPLSLPPQWYLADLQLPSGPVIGATLPGLPMILVGRSDRLIWGVQSVGFASATIPNTNEIRTAADFLRALQRLMNADDAVQASRWLDEISVPGFAFVIADHETLIEWPTTPRQPGTPEDFRRIRRDRLDARQPVFSLDGAVAVLLDSVSEASRILLPIMAREFWFDDPATGETPPDFQALREDVLARLALWNGDMDRMSPEPLVYWAWVRALQRRILQDEFPAMEAVWNTPNPEFLYAVLRNRDGAAAWCDVRLSEQLETCQQMVGRALKDALDWITDRYGDDPSVWYWGAEHKLVMEWSAICDAGLLGSLVSLIAPISGGPDTQRVSFFDAGADRLFDTRYGSNFQAVMSLADANSSRYIIPAGQSGHPLSRFYDNMLLLWTQGDFLNMSTDVGVARGAAAGVARLFPSTSVDTQ
ncbi:MULTISPECIES: penicillin acylase family protein [unclassified Roseovarius]|uniref:penicillin acylase family protein n=1 Tax=unclassified Roseovarius TaxID=2614913 RepID=UPI00273F853B|nr:MULTISPECIES: penicillin acylase family protein [unclassified Roseovarius]